MVEERVKVVSADLGGTFDRPLAANQYDLRLLRYAEKKLDDNLAAIPDIQARLDSLRQRNMKFKT